MTFFMREGPVSSIYDGFPSFRPGSFSFLGKCGIILLWTSKREGGICVKGFSICGLVLGITATVCGVCAVAFSFLGLRGR